MGLYDVTEINMLALGTRKLGQYIQNKKVRQVNYNKRLHTPWPVKYFSKVGVNLILFTLKLLQGGKIRHGEKNVSPETVNGNIILDYQTKS